MIMDEKESEEQKHGTLLPPVLKDLKTMNSRPSVDEERILHPFPPLFNTRSRILILGSFPSVMSRTQQFYYGHPRNRFWPVIAALYGQKIPETIPEKTKLILSHGLALWDAVSSCRVTGSSDASIRAVQPNALGPLLAQSDIQRIFCNGKTAWQLYQKYLLPETGREAGLLPSTSPANARWTLEALIAAWSCILEESTL